MRRSAGPLLLLAMLAMLVLQALPALAADTATITGTVVDGSNKGRPVDRIEVILSQGNVETQTPGEQQTTTTDRNGVFTFEDVDAGDQWQYDVGATFEGELYLSDAIEPKPGGTEEVELTVYETTSSPEDITQVSWIMFLDEDPAGVAVEQDVAFQNKGKETYVGTGTPDTRAVTSLPVFPGADPNSFQALGMYIGPNTQYQVSGSTYSNTAALPPGLSEGTMRYVAPVPEGPVQVPVEFPVKEFDILAAPGFTVTAPGFENVGPQDVEGVTYTLYVAQDLAAGASFSLDVTGSGGGGDVNSSKAVGAILLAVALLGALFLIVVRLRNPSQAASKPSGPRKPPAKQPKGGGKQGTNRQAKPSRSERAPADDDDEDDDVEAELLVAELAALDLSFEQGLIAEDDYRALRDKRKAQLLKMRRGDQG